MTNPHSDVNLSAAQAQSTIDPSTTLGVVVSWDFGFDAADCVAIPRERVRSILADQGFDPKHFIDDPSDEQALVRAHRDIQWGTRCGIPNAVHITKLKSEKGVPASYGVLITRTEGEERAAAHLGARVRVNPTGGFAVDPPVDDEMNAAAEKVARAVAAYAGELATTAFNQDLVAVLKELRNQTGVVAMRRKGGGAYFIPQGKPADRFVAVLDALEQETQHEGAAHRFYAHVTVLHADQRNVATWSRNTTMSFDDEVRKLAEELQGMSSRDNVRDSSWEKKKGECGALMRRAERFAMLLEGNLDRIKTELANLETEFGTAQDQATKAKAKANAAFARIAQYTEDEDDDSSSKSKGQRGLNALSAFRRVASA